MLRAGVALKGSCIDGESFMETLQGYVERIQFQNEKNGFTVIKLISDGKEKYCIGFGLGISQGDNIEAQGEYEQHPSYGKQFRIKEYRVIKPTNAMAMERYLGSGAIKGIGEKMAAKIVKEFGEDTFRVIEEEPERLAKIKGISLKKAQEIAVQMEEKKDLREAMVFLSGYGISNSMAVKIYDRYHLDTYQILKENPYQLAEDIQGIGFKIADEIAEKSGIRPDSDYRIRCGVNYILQQAVVDGHVYLPREILVERSESLLGATEIQIQSQIDNMVTERKLIQKEEAVYQRTYYRAELLCARMLQELNIPMDGGVKIKADEDTLDEKLERIARRQGMELDELQKNAVKTCIKNGLFILSGGPGTGKTSTINMIIHYFEEEGKDILLAAPTGRAAKRMTEATGMESRTIHRLLEMTSMLSDSDSGNVVFERNEDNPLEADVIIIDEMSMVDLWIFQALLKAVQVGTRLILVGDVDQLPSVGPGQVLRDLMDSGCFPTVVLQKIFRQDEGSDIILNAHRINRGEEIKMDNKSKDFFVLERNDIDVIYKHMIELIREKLPGYVHSTPFDIQVLTPMRKGPLGCETLNVILQRYLNPQEPGKPEHESGEVIFRLGDKVMQIKNNYQLEWKIYGKNRIVVDEGTGVFNGDMGRVVELSESDGTLVVEYDECRRVEYPFSSLEELEHAYAITIHKSQGSEYPAVILPLLGGARVLLTRNLLYTAVTRARNSVVILGKKETVQEMIANVSEKRRYTSLAERIRELA